MTRRIPAVGHLIWFGPRYPWTHVAAVRSALRHGGLQKVVFHHDAETEAVRAGGLDAIEGLELRPIDAEATFEAAGQAPARLLELYRQLSSPSARSNMLRAALLASEGGVYLDCDTVTVGDLSTLFESGFHCGRETVVYPREVAADPRLSTVAHAKARSSLRSALATVPGGWRAFRALERGYPSAANNAVLASEPGHPFAKRLLNAMLEVPEARRTVRFALGTHLLQAEIAAAQGPDAPVVHPPEVFFPLGPAISRHWFRNGTVQLERMLTPRTRVVHWYASVENEALLDRMDEAHVLRHAQTQPFSALVRRYGLESSDDRRDSNRSF